MNKANKGDYSLFFNFIDAYIRQGFSGIDTQDPLILELEQMMELNNQFFYIADLILLNILYTSKRSKQIIGLEPDKVDFYQFLTLIHPDDQQRQHLGRLKVIKSGQEHFVGETGSSFISTNLRLKNPSGQYSNILYQGHVFSTEIPRKSVYLLMVLTDISWYKKMRNGYHYSISNDPSMFRFPDKQFLRIGNVFSDREFEIIKLIETGNNSNQISEKLFLSVHTVDTHRRNILKKTGKKSITELIYDLKERGNL